MNVSTLHPIHLAMSGGDQFMGPMTVMVLNGPFHTLENILLQELARIGRPSLDMSSS